MLKPLPGLCYTAQNCTPLWQFSVTTQTGKQAVYTTFPLIDKARPVASPGGLAPVLHWSFTCTTDSFPVVVITEKKATVLCCTAVIVQTWHGDGDIQIVSGVTGCLRVLLCCIVLTASSITVSAPQTTSHSSKGATTTKRCSYIVVISPSSRLARPRIVSLFMSSLWTNSVSNMANCCPYGKRLIGPGRYYNSCIKEIVLNTSVRFTCIYLPSIICYLATGFIRFWNEGVLKIWRKRINDKGVCRTGPATPGLLEAKAYKKPRPYAVVAQPHCNDHSNYYIERSRCNKSAMAHKTMT